MTAEAIKDLVVSVLEDKSAVDISVIPVGEKTIVADYFVICTGRSRPQVRAIYEAVAEKLKDAEVPCRNVDGEHDSKWIVLDYDSVIVHIFNDETRVFYCLEKLWSERHVSGADDADDADDAE